jgi:hypothetical protein
VPRDFNCAAIDLTIALNRMTVAGKELRALVEDRKI